MPVVRRIARPMLAAIFVSGGLEVLRHPKTHAEFAAPLITRVSQYLSLPDDPETLVRANGATMMAAAAMLAMGKLPRAAAVVLAGTLIPATLTEYPFWTVKDPTLRVQQRAHFLKNVSLLGGVLLAAVDTAGKPGLLYRTKSAQAGAHQQATLTKREARRAIKVGQRATARQARRASLHARHFAKHALD
jgi:putative oxidoreductase